MVDDPARYHRADPGRGRPDGADGRRPVRAVAHPCRAAGPVPASRSTSATWSVRRIAGADPRGRAPTGRAERAGRARASLVPADASPADPGGVQPADERDPAHPGRRGGRDHRRARVTAGVELTVTDGCGGIPEADLGPGLRRRLAGEQRPDPGAVGRNDGRARSGAGLGLAIVKGIVEAHAGRVERRQRRDRAAGSPCGCRRPAGPGPLRTPPEPARGAGGKIADRLRVSRRSNRCSASLASHSLGTAWGPAGRLVDGSVDDRRELSEGSLGSPVMHEEDAAARADRREQDGTHGWWRSRQGARRRAGQHRAPVRQGLGHAPRRRDAGPARGDPDRLDRARRRPRHRRPAARPRRRDLRSGVVRQDHGRAARGRQRPARPAASSPSSTPSTRSTPTTPRRSASTPTPCSSPSPTPVSRRWRSPTC